MTNEVQNQNQPKMVAMLELSLLQKNWFEPIARYDLKSLQIFILKTTDLLQSIS
jgi:hypothetical protein